MELKLKTNGVCLSSLFEVIASASCDFEGLIIGTPPRITKTTKVTDTADNVEKTSCEQSKYNYINLILPHVIQLPVILFFSLSPDIINFYTTPTPQTLFDTIQAYRQRKPTQEEYVIGWFKFRRNTPLIPSVKEQSVNSKFVQEAFGSQGIQPIFVLFTESVKNGGGNHWIRSVMYRAFRNVPGESYGRRIWKLEGTSLEVMNVESSSVKEYDEFKTHSRTNLSDQILDGVMVLESSLEKYMDSLSKEAQFLIGEIQKTEREISLLSKK